MLMTNIVLCQGKLDEIKAQSFYFFYPDLPLRFSQNRHEEIVPHSTMKITHHKPSGLWLKLIARVSLNVFRELGEESLGMDFTSLG